MPWRMRSVQKSLYGLCDKSSEKTEILVNNYRHAAAVLKIAKPRPLDHQV